MKDNIKQAMLITTAVVMILFSTCGYAQVTDTAAVDKIFRWQVNASLNPIISELVGGNLNTSQASLSLQAKRTGPKFGLRVGVDHFGFNSMRSNPFEFKSVGLVNDSVVYQSKRSGSTMTRLLVGFERGIKVNRIRYYGGIDFSAGKGKQGIQVTDFVSNINHLDSARMNFYKISFPDTNYRTVEWNAWMVGLRPLIGIEMPMTSRFGVNLEARSDISIYSTANYEVHASDIIGYGRVSYFRVLPLLDFRLYYRF